MTLTLITVSKNQYNIPTVLQSIAEQYISGLEWHIIFDFDAKLMDKNIEELLIKNTWIQYRFMPDKRNSLGGGNYGKDILIKEVTSGWIYQIDDDNILYPNFINEFTNLLVQYPHSNIFCFWQYGRYTPNTKIDLRVGIVDTAMYIFQKNISVGVDYPVEYGGDGRYLETMLKNENTNLHIEKKYLCYYNFIKENTMSELCKIAKKHRTDKYHRHNYCTAYENILAKYKDKSDISLLEIGIFEGASIRMWLEWLPKAKIYGIDNWSATNKPININGAKIINANSKDISVCDKLEQQTFDIIIDDGDHHPYSQLTTLWNMWPLLKRGGIYIIEDLDNFDLYQKHWSFISNIEFIDMRKDGGTYDSVLLIIKKKQEYDV